MAGKQGRCFHDISSKTQRIHTWLCSINFAHLCREIKKYTSLILLICQRGKYAQIVRCMEFLHITLNYTITGRDLEIKPKNEAKHGGRWGLLSSIITGRLTAN